MFHKPPIGSTVTHSLDITALESRLLFSATAMVDLALVPDAISAKVDVPVHHAPAEQVNAELIDNRLASDSITTQQQDAADTTPSFSGNPNAETNRLRGDFNHDGLVDVTDVNMLGKMLQGTERNSEYDLNRDGGISQLDLDVLIRDVLKTEYGDTNLDGKVNTLDAKEILSHMFQNVSGWQNGDMNFDGWVDGGDFILWNANKYKAPRLTPNETLNLADQPTHVTPSGQLPVPASDQKVVHDPATAASVKAVAPPEKHTSKTLRVDDASTPIFATNPATNARTSNPDKSRVETAVPVTGPITVVPVVSPTNAGSMPGRIEARIDDRHDSTNRKIDKPADDTVHTSRFKNQIWLASREFHRDHSPSVSVPTISKLRRQGPRPS